MPELLARLPDTFDLLVLQSPGVKADYGQLPGLTFLDSPLTPAKLIEMLVSLLNTRMAPSPVGGQADKATVQKRTAARRSPGPKGQGSSDERTKN